jgi:rhodanese-related sulfurtransferase
MSAVQSVVPESLKQLYEADPALLAIDVRTPAEYRSLHAPFAQLWPLDTLNGERAAELTKTANGKTVYIFCKGGTRAEMAAKKLKSLGLHNVSVVRGGVTAWEAAGYPVNRGKKAISLDRQVRIVAGGLVVLGVLLGITVHTGFLGLSAFVGCGLVFAGITDTCAMGMILSRMPWNRGGSQSCSR